MYVHDLYFLWCIVFCYATVGCGFSFSNNFARVVGANVKILDNAIAAMFLSFLVGMLGNAMLRRLEIYERLSNMSLFSDPRSFENMGILWFRKFLLATPLRFFNTNIRFSSNRSTEALDSIRKHMANAEVSHWVGFFAMLLVMVAAWWYRGFAVGLAYLVLNVLGNLYPCLLQQYNKSRLTRVITATKKRNGGASSPDSVSADRHVGM